MATFKSIKQDLQNSLEKAQSFTDRAKVQAALGQAELNDVIDEQQLALNSAIENLTDKASQLGVVAEDVTDQIKSKTDALKVQAALGQMEGKDAFSKAKDSIEQQLEEAEGLLDKAEAQSEEQMAQLKDSIGVYVEKARDFKASVAAKMSQLND